MNRRSPQDIAAGLLFIAVGLAGLWFGRNLEVGSASFMQGGYMPRLACWILIGIGGIVLLRALFQAGAGLERWAWRPLLLLTATILGFGFLINRAGLVIATLAIVVVANFAARPLPWSRLLPLAAGLAALMVGLFHFGLGLPIPLWPA